MDYNHPNLHKQPKKVLKSMGLERAKKLSSSEGKELKLLRAKGNALKKMKSC